MDLRTLQKPLKDQYRADPNSSRITIRAKGAQSGAPISCSVDIGRAIHQAEAHKGVGGEGAGACSGDLLLGALAACAQITCQMVAAAMKIPTDRIEVTVEGAAGKDAIRVSGPIEFELIHTEAVHHIEAGLLEGVVILWPRERITVANDFKAVCATVRDPLLLGLVITTPGRQPHSDSGINFPGRICFLGKAIWKPAIKPPQRIRIIPAIIEEK